MDRMVTSVRGGDRGLDLSALLRDLPTLFPSIPGGGAKGNIWGISGDWGPPNKEQR